MKIFQSFQKNSAYLGISSSGMQKTHNLNVKNVFGLSVIGFGAASNIYFLCITTDSISENIFSLYMTAMVSGIFFIYLVVIWRMKSLFKFIDGIEKAMDTSMWNCESFDHKLRSIIVPSLILYKIDSMSEQM